MISQGILFTCAVSYILVLVAIAWWAESRQQVSNKSRAWIYGLTLAVYCSSWTFFGAVGTAVTSAWLFMPIYLGPILVFVCGQPLIRRLVHAGVRQKTTSIADFIGTRYGKRQGLAALVCAVAVVGSLPYIALQLRAISMAWGTVSAGAEQIDTTMVGAILLALFAMVFGTRHVKSRERNKGMMAALAVESLIKLVALLAVAVAAVILLWRADFSNPEIFQQMQTHWGHNPLSAHFVTVTLISALAVLCLPRQFHVMVVEYQATQDLKTARWLFPLYLLLISVAVFPIVIAGLQLSANSAASPDAYVLLVPELMAAEGLGLLAFIGGLSAATGMVIVAVTTLAIMISNEVVLPFSLRVFGQNPMVQTLIYGRSVKTVRRASLAVVMLMAWWMSRAFESGALASLGLLSFACFAQLAPALMGAVLWRGAHAYGVYAGLILGFSLWFFTLLLPGVGVLPSAVIEQGLFGVAWLKPQSLLGLQFDSALTHGVVMSLGANVLAFVLVSLRSQASPLDKLQSMHFSQSHVPSTQHEMRLSDINVGRLRVLYSAFVDEAQVRDTWRTAQIRYRQRLLDDDNAPHFLVESVERSLAGIIGASSSYRAVQLLRKADAWRLKELAEFMGSASAQLRFNQDLLHTTFESLPQGICVVDQDLDLVAWNQRYQELFDFPDRLLYVGCPIERLIRYNASRGMFGDGESQDQQVARRLELLRSGSDHQFERVLPTGVTIQVVGKLMPSGGFVTTFTDISEYKTMMSELVLAKDSMSERVDARTQELQLANQALAAENQLRAQAEQQASEMHTSKTRFLQATSHDLLQPISAARLFVAALLQQGQRVNVDQLPAQLGHVDKSLAMAEHLIGSLREIARLENRKIKPKIEPFDLGDLLEELAGEFSALAAQKQIEFRWVNCEHSVVSDRYLLRRILQNFLNNALHYTRRGKILLGCKRRGNALQIGVFDTGPGISEEALQTIFKEFERLDPGSTSSDKGMGLGLTIAQGIADLLGHELVVESSVGHGSVFSVLVETHHQMITLNTETPKEPPALLRNTKVLCIDNEQAIIEGLTLLLSTWGCLAEGVSRLDQFEARLNQEKPAIILLDYHLDEDLTGVALHKTLPPEWQQIPVVLISADTADSLKAEIEAAGFYYLSKPVKPVKLQQLMVDVLSK